MLDADTFTSPESVRGGAAGRRRGCRRCRPRARRPASRRSRWCVRPATMPSGTGRWASASSTTSRSPRRSAARAACRAWRSSTSTSITATARSGSSTTTRASYTCPPTSFRSTRAPARPTRSGSGAGAGFTFNVPLEAGATDADYALAYGAIVEPVLAAVRARAGARFRRLRRARARSAGIDAGDDRGLRRRRWPGSELWAGACGACRRDRRRLRPHALSRVRRGLDRRARSRGGSGRRLASTAAGARAASARVAAVRAAQAPYWRGI